MPDEYYDYEYLDYDDELMMDSNHADLLLDDRSDLANFTEINEECNENYEIKGYRVTDIRYLFQQIQDLYQHVFESNCNCNITDISLVRENRKGLKSTFVFQCSNVPRNVNSASQFIHSMLKRNHSI